MPYGKRRARDGSYTVFNLLTGKVYGKGMTAGRAERQMYVLRTSERRKQRKRRRHK